MPTQTSVNNEFRNNLTVSTATAGTEIKLLVENSDNSNAASHAALKVVTGGASAGDAFLHFSNSVVDKVFAIDNSDSDALVISASATPGTTNHAKCTTAGEWTYPLQPAFCAKCSDWQLNVTGDGTQYTVQFNSELFDNNSDFNTGTYTFTAPVAGKYLFGANIHYLYGAAANYRECFLKTSSGDFHSLRSTAAGAGGQGSVTNSVITSLDSGDTVYSGITVWNDTKIDDIDANFCYFYGALLQ